MLVELKNGETLNGHLVNCDNWMNLILKEVVQTSPEGDRFFKLPEVYIRGNNVCHIDAAYSPFAPALTSPDQIPTSARGDYRHRQRTAADAGGQSQPWPAPRGRTRRPGPRWWPRGAQPG